MRWRAWRAGLAAVVLVAACGLSGIAKKDQPPEFSAERLGDLSEQDSILDVLDPDEREAVERSGISGARPEHQPAPPEDESTADKAGKAAVSVLSVAISVGAAVAPYLLF